MTSTSSRGWWLGALLLVALSAGQSSAYPTQCKCRGLIGAGDPAGVELVDRCERRLERSAERRCLRRARGTHTVSLAGRLSADQGLARVPFDGADFATAYATSNFVMSATVLDPRGGRHEIIVFFSRETDGRTWQVHLAVDAGETGGRPGDLQLIGAGGTLRFDDAGVLSAAAGLKGTVAFKDAGPQRIRLDLFSMTEQPGPMGISCVSQDGCPGS